MKSIRLGDFKAVIFDLDSTLTDTHMYPVKATTWVLEQCAENADEVSEEYVRVLVDTYFQAIDAIVKGADYRPPYDVVRTAMANSLEHVCVEASPAILDEGTDYFKRLHIEMSTLNEGVEELLGRLQALGVRMGIITNSFEGHSRQILEKLGISEYFLTLVDGGDVRAYKPMKKPFKLALSKLDVNAEDAVFVGDEFYADIVGSKRAGLTNIWINTRDQNLEELVKKFGTDFRPDLIVKEIGALVNFI